MAMTVAKHHDPLKSLDSYDLHLRGSFETQKKTSYFPLYWLFNRDPYHGLLKPAFNCVV